MHLSIYKWEIQVRRNFMSNLNKSSLTPVFGWKIYLAIFLGTFAIAMLFAAYTNHAWEDYYITYRCSKNLATGHGLVYTPGEKVHTFTSPLNVLLPAMLNIVTANRSDALVLWLFRILCGFMLGTAAVLLLKTARKNSMTLIPTAVLIGLFTLESKIIDFSINGQEIAFMMLFIALTINVLVVPQRAAVFKMTLALAGLMWTRPDGFIYFGAIAVGFLLFGAGRSINKSRLDLIKLFFCAGLIAAILYLPWILWAWHYYGSPVPHTIIAKGLNRPFSIGTLLINFLTFPLQVIAQRTSVEYALMPTYFTFGGWHYTVFIYSRFITYICALYWCLPFARPQARAFSFAFMCSCFYLSHIAAFPSPWYTPSCAILCIFVFPHVVQQCLDFASLLKDKVITIKTFQRLTASIRLLSVLLVIAAFVITLCAAYQLRIQQRIVEDGNRKQIGLWLRQNAASPKDTVFSECLGYVGFFSQLKMYDYPGMSSPEMVAARRRLKSNNWAQLISQLQPDWLVLRPWDAEKIYKVMPHLLTQRYSRVNLFDVSYRIRSYQWLPGRNYLTWDQTFYIFKRKKTAL